MRMLSRLGVTIILLIASSLLAQDAPATSEALFGIDRIWDVHLTVSGQDWDNLSPPRGATMGGPNATGLPFQYVPARVKIAGHEFAKVGLRFKGQSTWIYSAGTLKRSFKIDFDRYAKGAQLFGLRKLNLHCNSTDPTHVREAIAYDTYRASGVAASRTAFGRVFLTIPGRCRGVYLGLYVIVEQFDERAMKRCFGSEQGLLLKPRTVLGEFGEDWNSRYEAAYNPRTPISAADQERIVDLAKLMRSSDADFAEGIGTLLDVEQFLRFLAVTVILANTDSPLNLPHNYYLAVPQRVGKVVWIPWDLNLALGSWNRAGKNQDELSLLLPSRMPLMHRVLDVGTNEDRYLEIVANLIGDACSAKAMQQRIHTAKGVVKEAIAKEASRSEFVTGANRPSIIPSDAERFHAPFTLEQFVERREASVLAQLAGKSEGRAGGWSIDGQNISAPVPTAEAADQHVRHTIARLAAPTDGALFDQASVLQMAAVAFGKLDGDQSGALDLTELRDCLAGPSRSAPSSQHDEELRQLLGQLSRGTSRTVTAKEWRTAINKWMPGWDRDRNNKWSRRELRALPIPPTPAGGPRRHR